MPYKETALSYIRRLYPYYIHETDICNFSVYKLVFQTNEGFTLVVTEFENRPIVNLYTAINCILKTSFEYGINYVDIYKKKLLKEDSTYVVYGRLSKVDLLRVIF